MRPEYTTIVTGGTEGSIAAVRIETMIEEETEDMGIVEAFRAIGMVGRSNIAATTITIGASGGPTPILTWMQL